MKIVPTSIFGAVLYRILIHNNVSESNVNLALHIIF